MASIRFRWSGFWQRSTALLVLLVAAVGLLALLFAAELRGQVITSRTVKLIVNYPAGSGTADMLARFMSEWLAHKWMRPVVVENIPGLTGRIGAEAVYGAEPDGHTLLVTPPGAMTFARHLPSLAYDPQQFIAVSLLATIPIVLVARSDLPASNLVELLAHARQSRDRLKIAHQGAGSMSHLTAEWFRLATALDVVHVPFRGSVAALQGLGDGRVDLMFDNLGSSLGAITSGQVKALAVASRTREPSLPGLPTVAELLPGFESSTWVAVVAPPKTPRHIAGALNADFVEGLSDPAIATRFRQSGCEPARMTPEATAVFLQSESEKWTKVVTTKGFRFE